MSTKLLPCTQFNVAKTQLSGLMSDVVRRHQPQVIERNRGKELMMLMRVDDLAEMLESFRFEPQVSVSDGEFVVRLPELNLIAGGETYDEAVEELVELVEEYGEDFMSRIDFFMQTDRRRHLPWLLRFALTPPERRAQLFAEIPAGVKEPAALPA